MSRQNLPAGGPKSLQKGFTILELMIATVVFSIVLLLVATGIMQIARVYYKGVTETNTQNTARSIIDTISQAIQFSGGIVTLTEASPAAGTDYTFCVGNEQFTYRLGWQVEDEHNPDEQQTWHALVQKSAAGADCNSSPDDIPVLTDRDIDGRDLVGQHMRLSKLAIELVGQNTYRVTVKIVYGDSDLLSSPITADASCLGVQAGSQFCSVAELSTIVVKRVE